MVHELLTPFAVIWKYSNQKIISEITSFLLTPRLHQTFQTIGKEMIW